MIHIPEKDKRVILECLKAAALGPFFPDWEFSTLLGLGRKEVEKVVADWPHIDWSDQNVILAVNNSINNLLGYPHNMMKEWPKYISVGPDEVNRVYQSWRKAMEQPSTGADSKGYFDGLM